MYFTPTLQISLKLFPLQNVCYHEKVENHEQLYRKRTEDHNTGHEDYEVLSLDLESFQEPSVQELVFTPKGIQRIASPSRLQLIR